ncbi:ankyrin repeat-containing domain protein, partial [Echria macrotheca]
MHGNLALYYAARRGEADIINILLDQGADISRRYDGKRTILMEACSSGSFPAVKALIDKGVDIGAQTEKGRTALEIAAGTGTREIVKLLLSHGAKISENDAGQTALSLSAWVGHTETIKEMIESWKALPTTVDKNSWTLLHVAASSGHVDVVNYLLGKGLSITARNTEGLTPLLCAAESGKLATVKLLLAHDKKSCRDLSAIATNAATAGLPNADVSTERTGPLSALDMPDNYGFTPLMAAAGKGWTDIVRALLSAGADINKRNKSSWTAFQLAAEAGFLSVVKLLLSVATSGGCEGRGLHQEPGLCNAAAGGRAQVAKYLLQRAHESVDAAPASHKKKTALFWAAAEGQTEMVSFLLSRGAAVKPPVSTEVSALHAAVVRGHLDTVKVLISLQSGGLESGEARNNAKLSPIHLATEHPKVLAFLLGLGNPDRTTQVNLCDDSKILPMHVAASYGQVESIKVLHSHGGYIDAPDAKGRTPLLVAAGCGKAEAVDCFLKLGASINAEDDGGWCALHHAAGSGSVETLNRLLDKYPESTDKSRTTRIPPGRTALHIAAKSTKEGMLKLLIEQGIDVNKTSATRSTALHYA